MKHRGLQFVQGLFSGALISAIVLLVLTIADTAITGPLLHPAMVPPLDAAGDWVFRNLGYSLIPFSVVLILYLFTLRSLAVKL